MGMFGCGYSGVRWGPGLSQDTIGVMVFGTCSHGPVPITYLSVCVGISHISARRESLCFFFFLSSFCFCFLLRL